MTPGESTFTTFCSLHGIPCERINTAHTPTPDYKIELCGVTTYVEIKDIEEDKEFSSPLMRRTPGAHVRAKIEEARSQLQPASRAGFPALLLIYNALDSIFQAFGTEIHDFLAGMYGEVNGRVNPGTNRIEYFFGGRNKSLRVDKNTSFSAVGCLYTRNGSPSVTLYENVFAKNPLNFEALPTCFEFCRILLIQDK